MSEFVENVVGAGRSVPLVPGMQEHWLHQDMVVAALHGTSCPVCENVRTGLAAVASKLTARDAEPVHVDASGAPELMQALGATTGDARVGVVDRYGRLFSVIDPHGADTADVIREIVSWVDFLQEQCEECGAPTW